MKTDLRQELIEIASTRPYDIERFYRDNTVIVNGHTVLTTSSPVPLLFKGKLRNYDASSLPALLAGVKPGSCKNKNCINPDHMNMV